MKFPITPTIEDHGEVSGFTVIDVSKIHIHKLAISGTAILNIRDNINGTEKQIELEIEVTQ